MNKLKNNDHIKFVRIFERAIAKQSKTNLVECALMYFDLAYTGHGGVVLMRSLLLSALNFL